MSRWQSESKLVVPSVVALLMLTPLPGAFMGFPRRLYMSGIELWCKVEAQYCVDTNGRSPYGQKVHSVSQSLQTFIWNEDYPIFEATEETFFGDTFAYNWLSGSLRKVYNALDFNRQSLSRTCADKKTAENVLVILVPKTEILLHEFNPLQWAQRLRMERWVDQLQSISPIGLL